MHLQILAAVVLVATLVPQSAMSAPDYSKRLQNLDKAVETSLLGKWTNPVDRVVIEIDAVDLESGKISGKVLPTTGPAAADEHELTGWVNAAPVKEGFDNVTPITFSTTLYEYGTLPAWAGFLKDGRIVTMHYLVWPNKTYSWDHISSYSETWTKL
jgi:hypothetical protein